MYSLSEGGGFRGVCSPRPERSPRAKAGRPAVVPLSDPSAAARRDRSDVLETVASYMALAIVPVAREA